MGSVKMTNLLFIQNFAFCPSFQLPWFIRFVVRDLHNHWILSGFIDDSFEILVRNSWYLKQLIKSENHKIYKPIYFIFVFEGFTSVKLSFYSPAL